MTKTRVKAAIGGAIVGLAVLLFAARPSFAQPPTPRTGTVTHEQMHTMMDAMDGAGTSQRMHEAMGADAEKLMDQCVSMMGMMQNMQGMMDGNMSGMMGGQSMQDMMKGGGMSGMMGGQNGQSTPDMMQPAPVEGR